MLQITESVNVKAVNVYFFVNCMICQLITDEVSPLAFISGLQFSYPQRRLDSVQLLKEIIQPKIKTVIYLLIQKLHTGVLSVKLK